MKLFNKTPQINFLNYYKYAFCFSILFIAIGLISITMQGIETSIDFTGGTIIHIEVEDENLNIVDLRKQVGEALQSNVNVVEAHSLNANKSLIITMDFLDDEAALNKLLAKYFKSNYKIIQIESIGPKLGNELKTNAKNAILASLLLIGLYITIRFDKFYALGSLAALLHDVFVILSIFSLFNFEISVAIIAAFLTIVGYSLNDTIVIYDRIRENLLKFSNDEKQHIINRSLNETLSRTIITSITTLFVVLSLYFFGGEILKPFALALIIGIIIGTYSSIFIASPIMFLFEKKFNVIAEGE